MKELGMSVMMLLNSLTGNTDPNFSNDKLFLEELRVEIKEAKRKVEWIDATEEDYATKYVKVERIKKDLLKKAEKLKQIEKRIKLKEKWAKEDSLEMVKKYPPLRLDLFDDEPKKEDEL